MDGKLNSGELACRKPFSNGNKRRTNEKISAAVGFFDDPQKRVQSGNRRLICVAEEIFRKLEKGTQKVVVKIVAECDKDLQKAHCTLVDGGESRAGDQIGDAAD
jgi:hypothetical protein